MEALKPYYRNAKNSFNKFRWRYFSNPSFITNPVLIYQMGKVASSSVYSSLKSNTDFDVFHVHRLNPKNVAKVRDLHPRSISNVDEQGLYLYRNLFENPKIPLKLISLVREPIGRNISAFFQNLYYFDSHKDIEKIDLLIQNFIDSYPHNTPLEWFDVELHSTTGIDVYQHDFPFEQGYQVIDFPPFHLLVMRHDLDDRLKENFIANFLGLKSFKLTRANEASLKGYSEAYSKFIASIKIPEDYAKELLCSKYSQHFYSLEERRTIYEKWTGSTSDLVTLP